MNRTSMYELLALDEELNTAQLLREHVPDALRYLVDRRARLVAVIKRMRDAESEGSPLPNVGQERATQTEVASTTKYRVRPVGQRRKPDEFPTVIAEGRCNRCDGPWQLADYWRLPGTKHEFLDIGFAFDPEFGWVQLCPTCTRFDVPDSLTAEEEAPGLVRPGPK